MECLSHEGHEDHEGCGPYVFSSKFKLSSRRGCMKADSKSPRDYGTGWQRVAGCVFE
jgi:hypothetical protein